MILPYYVVDAFTGLVFGGNPAGVCPLSEWLADELLQKIAFENNLSETAFFVRENNGWRLRWFAPNAEVDLCGHATLAAAFVLNELLREPSSTLRFETRSGDLAVTRGKAGWTLDFPALPLEPCAAPEELVAGIGQKPVETFRSMDYVAVLESEEAVRAVRTDEAALRKLDARGVIVTAAARDCDYVLRCFGPKIGIAEDPATGSAQCALAPYWSRRLKKNRFSVRQLSARGAQLDCELAGARVKISGQAALYLRGEIVLPF